MLLMSYVDMNKANGKDMWFLDSGCNNHMYSVKAGNNSSVVVMGKGNVQLQVNGRVQIITSVLCVELKNNLLSIRQLQEKGLNIHFKVKSVKSSACFNTITEDMVQLWHCRYGHLSFKGLKTLQEKKMVNGLPQLKSPSRLCKACLVGKQQRFSFPRKSTWRASQILQLVHADICGPIKPISNGKKRYLITFIDDFIEHFRVFRCIFHVHVLTKRTKLDDKSLSCVLLGVSEESKAYRLYDPGKKYEESIVSELEWGDLEEEATMFDDNEVDPNEEGANLNRSEANVEAVKTMKQGRYFEEDNEAHLAHLAMFATIDPIHFEDAMKSEKWRKAMDLEMEAIKNNGTWELKELPKEAKKVGVKWIYKTKFNENGEVDKYKARLVVKGILSTLGRLSEVFVPMARMETIRLVEALVAQKDGLSTVRCEVYILHGELNEVVFVEQPCGYVQKGNEQKVYRLKKALYGLKQAPRAWYNRTEAYFMKESFEKCDYEHTLFIKTSKEGKVLIVSLYVDDLIFTGNYELMFTKFKNSMKHEFDMTDLGKMRYFLGLEVLQRSMVFYHQKKYALEVLKQFEMDKSNFVHNPIVSALSS
ncbi:hypothetical protein AAG906_019097 [Vitis piasezkii]